MRYCLFLLIFLYSCKQKAKPPSDCARFKTGTFALEDDGTPLRITRTADTQIEKNLLTGHIHKLRIKWENDCRYKLTFLESTDSVMAIATKDMTLTVEITKTEGDTYYFDSFIGEGKIVSFKMRKLK